MKNRKTIKTPEQTYLALKYPDYYNWRDLDSAMKNGGFWPSGETVRLSDPEMAPWMDEMKAKLEDPEFAREFLKRINLK